MTPPLRNILCAFCAFSRPIPPSPFALFPPVKSVSIRAHPWLKPFGRSFPRIPCIPRFLSHPHFSVSQFSSRTTLLCSQRRLKNGRGITPALLSHDPSPPEYSLCLLRFFAANPSLSVCSVPSCKIRVHPCPSVVKTFWSQLSAYSCNPRFLSHPHFSVSQFFCLNLSPRTFAALRVCFRLIAPGLSGLFVLKSPSPKVPMSPCPSHPPHPWSQSPQEPPAVVRRS